MFYVKLILYIIVFLVLAYFFVNNLSGRFSLHKLRLKMQESGAISKDKNIGIITFFSLMFWLLPIWKFKEVGNINHNQKVNRINKSLLFLLVGMIGYVVLAYFLR